MNWTAGERVFGEKARGLYFMPNYDDYLPAWPCGCFKWEHDEVDSDCPLCIPKMRRLPDKECPMIRLAKAMPALNQLMAIVQRGRETRKRLMLEGRIVAGAL